MWIDRGWTGYEPGHLVDKSLASPCGPPYRRYQPGGVIETEPERLVRQSLGRRDDGSAGLFRARYPTLTDLLQGVPP